MHPLTQLIYHDMKPALGVTEPGAIAFAVAPWPIPLRFSGKCQGAAPARRGCGTSVPENGWAVSLKRLSFPFDPSVIYGEDADMIKVGHKFFCTGE